MRWWVIRNGEVVGEVHAPDEIAAAQHAEAQYPPTDDEPRPTIDCREMTSGEGP